MERRGISIREAVPYLIGAALSVALVRSIIASPFFLLPIAFLACWHHCSNKIWITVIAASLMNSLLAWFITYPVAGSSGLVVDIFYFAVCSLLYTGAALPLIKIRRIYRFILAAFLLSIVSIPIFIFLSQDTSLKSLITMQTKTLSNTFIETANSDVVQQSLVEQALNSDTLLQTIMGITYRTSAFIYSLIFLINWLIASLILNKRLLDKNPFRKIQNFKNNRLLIWLLILALFVLFAGLVFSLELVEIIGWNISLVSTLLFSLQGFGIIQFNLARPSIPPLFKLLSSIVLLLLFLRPGINAIAFIVIALLGIAETWLPLRVAIHTEPPSTPEV